jgi:PAS domain S-box-containing protein
MNEKKRLINSTENSESTEKPEKELSTLSSLHEISKSLLSEHDLGKLLDTIAEKALLVLGADLVTLYEYNKNEDDVKIPPIIKGKVKKVDILHQRGEVIPHKESITFKMIERNKPFYAENAKKDWVKEKFISRRSVKKEDSFINREEIKSSAGIPLYIEEEVVGVLFVNYRDTHRFTPARKDRIEMFANYAALAIRNARIFSKSQRYVKQLSVLSEIGKKISSASTMDIDEILYVVYEQTQRIMDATNFYIALYDEQNDTVHFKLAIEGGSRQKVGVGEWKSRKSGVGLTEYIIREKKPLLLSRDAEKWIRSQKNVNGIGKPTKSWLGAPMIIENKVMGVIGVQSYEKENVYDEDHRNVLATIASKTAIAISKANIFQKEKKRVQELEALYDTSKEINEKSLSIKKVLQAIVKRAVELSSAQNGSVLLCNHAKEELKCVITYNLDELLGTIVKFGTGVAGRVAVSGEPFIKNEYHKWERRLPKLKEKGYKDLIKASVGVPLKSEGKILGVLAMSSSDENHIFTQEDVRLLKRFAVPAAIAIKNARTYDYLHTLIDSTPDAIIAVDTEGIVTEFNRASEGILEYIAADVIGKSVVDLYWGGWEEAMKINLLLRENGKIKNEEAFVKSKKGEKIPIRLSGSLLYDENGEWIGSVGHMEDMREIRLLEDRYRALYEVGKVAVEIPESDMRKICQEFMDVLTKRVLHFKATYVCLVNEENELELMAVGGAAEGYTILRRAKRIFSQFRKTKESIYIKNVQKDKRFKYLEWAKRNKIYSSLVIPLIGRSNIIGEITVFKGEECEFSEEEKEFLNRFASLAALVIDKAKDVNRSKRITKILQEITYAIVELSGEDIYGDILDKLTKIINKYVPGTNFCLYNYDVHKDKLAVLMESSSEELLSRLKTRFYSGKSPLKSKKCVNSDYLILQTRSYGHSGRLEGFLLFEKIPTKDGLIAKFTEFDSLILSMVASAVGVALFRLRRQLQQNHALISEANNIRNVE